jgi:Cdc6-like AAA superfamily ATPase
MTWGVHATAIRCSAHAIGLSSSDARKAKELLRRISCHTEEISECVHCLKTVLLDVEER